MVILPPKSIHEHNIYFDAEKRIVHILDLEARNLSKRKLLDLVNEICLFSGLTSSNYSWYYYGLGQVSKIKEDFTVLKNNDAYLYPPYKSRMFLDNPYRGI